MISTCEKYSCDHTTICSVSIANRESTGTNLVKELGQELVKYDLVSNGSSSCELICSVCNDLFQNYKQFIDHLRSHGIELERKESTCDDLTFDKDQLENSEQNNKTSIVQVIRPYKCHQCELVFDRKSQLDKHERNVHRQERSQVCQICGKGFFRQTDLKTHLNIHLGTNRCICEVCGKKFNHMSNLIRHSRTHSGVKPYPCTMCGKRFTQINTLARHKNIHQRGYESIECCFCDKQYKTEIGHREHMKKLHGFTQSVPEEYGKIMKRQHYCNICGESFQFVELLRDHEKHHQNVQLLECKSCDQKFKKAHEIKDHSCGSLKPLNTNERRPRKILANGRSDGTTFQDQSGVNLSGENESVLTQLGGVNEDSKESPTSEQIYPSTDACRLNALKNCSDPVLQSKLCQTTSTSPNKLTEQTKETIVYVTTEQLANMNTEQVVDTANHFLHEHLLELATESSLQTENMSSTDCDNETVVSEMINSCWREIGIPEVNDTIRNEKKAVASKNNAQSIIYVHALEKDGVMFLQDNGNFLSKAVRDVTPEKCLDMKRDSSTTANSMLHAEFKHAQARIQIGESEYTHNHSSDLIQNETLNRKVLETKLSPNKFMDYVLHDNTNRNIRERSRKEEQNTCLVPKVMRQSKPQIKRHDSREGNYDNVQYVNDNLLNSSVAHNIVEELFKHNTDNVNAVVGMSSENQEPTLRLVQTENGQQFYELLITNSSEKLETAGELNPVPSATINENFRPMENESIPESLLKLIQLENGQRVLEVMRSTPLDETDIAKISTRPEKAVNIDPPLPDTTLLEKNAQTVFETVRYDDTRPKTLMQNNKCDKILYLSQNKRDTLIDFFEIETIGTQEADTFNLVSEEVMGNVSQSSFDHLQTLSDNKNSDNDESPIDNESCEELLELIQNNPLKYSENSKHEFRKTRRTDGPMVRLVQNEDGAQFFELIRGDLEFDETRDFEIIQTNEEQQAQSSDFITDTNSLTNSCIVSSSPINDIGDKTKVESDDLRKKKQKTNAKKYNCDVCKKSFSKGYNYKQHIGTHFADQQKFKCEECGTFFAWKSTLNKHMAIHRSGGQQKFVCEICPKVYTTLSQVNEHVKRDHLKERNHKCHHCPKTFFKKFDLKIHIRTHTKERPYECRICYKSFHHQSHIIRHERIHSGERPYACNICEKAFTQLGSLKNHRQRHQKLKIDILDYQMDEDDPLP